MAGLFVLANPLDRGDAGRLSRHVEAEIGSPSRVNPLFAYRNDVDRDLVSLVFAGLTRAGPSGEVLPDLAETWEVSDDGLVYTFHIRANATWHNGAAVTADDVTFTYSLLSDPALEGNPDQQALWRQVQCQSLSQRIVQCVLPQAYAPFLSFTSIGILPKDLLAGSTASSLAESPFNQSPVGAGPFRLEAIDQERAILRADPDYHLGSSQIEELEMRFYPNIPTAVAAVARGEAGSVLLGMGAGQSDFGTLASSRKLNGYSANRAAYTILFLNNRQPPFDDVRVRRAIARAVDVGSLISNNIQGRAAPADSPIVPGTWAHNPSLKPYTQDRAEAESLLDEAGWTLSEGKVRKRDGQELRISLLTDRDGLRSALAEEIARQLGKVGIAVDVKVQDSTELIKDSLLPGRYEAALFGWEMGADPDPYPAWHSSQTGETEQNLAGYASREADALLEEARRIPDQSFRQGLYFRFQQLFHDDVPSLVLYYPVYTYFVEKDVEGVKLGTLLTPASRFGNIHEWKIDNGK